MIKRFFNRIWGWIKAFWKWLLSLFGIGVVALALTTGGPTLDMASIQNKYDQAPQIQSEYRLEKTALIQDAKDENSIKIKVGDEKADNFEPEFTISRWEDEVSFKIKPRIGLVSANDKEIKFEGDKIKFETPKIDYHFYDLGVSASHSEGAYEFEVILKEKPASNVITFDIEVEGLDFWYQPELTQEEIDMGMERQENTVGSYAVYRSENSINYTSGKEYRTGKAFHIFRPQIEDSNGWKIWGELNIDIENKIQTITIPQDFIDNAVYPIRHATGETFGYTTCGTSGSIFNSSQIANGHRATGAAGTVQKITACLSLSTDFKGVLHLQSDGTIISNGVTASGTSPSTKDWADAVYGTDPTVSAVDYYVTVINNGSMRVWYDVLSATRVYDTSNSYTTPEDVTGAPTYTGVRLSIYATYTPSATPTPEAAAAGQSEYWWND